MKNLDDFINHLFPPVEDKPGYVWINKRNHEIAKEDLIKEQIKNIYEQYCILQKKLNPNNTKEVRMPLCKGLQQDMAIIDEFLTKEKGDGN